MRSQVPAHAAPLAAGNQQTPFSTGRMASRLRTHASHTVSSSTNRVVCGSKREYQTRVSVGVSPATVTSSFGHGPLRGLCSSATTPKRDASGADCETSQAYAILIQLLLKSQAVGRLAGMGGETAKKRA
ncbi:hypothetical protein BU16DRAFT_334590 [Lophium mytilinum]|uniref:Uncharacterized protein n=1 Tax=Lophium mytilinum TaxID=390894 RepID=A0A6A6R1K2_9PEZI|nr:hypothetical protein BU16DRAFT_334590 [Lophium mytilinum]